MSKRAAEWLLAAVIFARSTSLLFAWLGCTGSSTALLVLSMAAGAGFVVAVNCLTNSRPARTELKAAAAAAK